MKALSNVAADIRNAEAAAAIPGLRGSDSMAKITRALDGGLLDSGSAKFIGGIKGLGALRAKGAELVSAYKGRVMSELLADPKLAAQALQDSRFVAGLDSPTLKRLTQAAYRAAPVLATD
jgi:hypothetical protein